jgi:hypothetical protein
VSRDWQQKRLILKARRATQSANLLESSMSVTRRAVTIGGLGVLAGTAMGTIARAEIGEGIRDIAEGLDDFGLTTDAYVFGYPLVTMEMTRRVITNVAGVEGTHGPMGQMIKLRGLSSPK